MAADSLFAHRLGPLPTILAALGVLAMFAASILLARESTLAVKAVNEEMDPVSYTHLDVYKRQESGSLHQGIPFMRLDSMGCQRHSMCTRRPVSYTHLDVYKRQWRGRRRRRRSSRQGRSPGSTGGSALKCSCILKMKVGKATWKQFPTVVACT